MAGVHSSDYSERRPGHRKPSPLHTLPGWIGSLAAKREASPRCSWINIDNRVKEMSDFENFDAIPDVRDGLNKKERTILYCLRQAQREFGDRNVPTILLYGRVLEFVDIGKEEFQTILSRFAGLTRSGPE
jgi:hypothetical protein